MPAAAQGQGSSRRPAIARGRDKGVHTTNAAPPRSPAAQGPTKLPKRSVRRAPCTAPSHPSPSQPRKERRGEVAGPQDGTAPALAATAAAAAATSQLQACACTGRTEHVTRNHSCGVFWGEGRAEWRPLPHQHRHAGQDADCDAREVGRCVCLSAYPPARLSVWHTVCAGRPAVRSSVCRPLVASGMKKRLSAGWSATLVICTLRPPERAGGLRASQAPAGTTASRTPPPSRHHCRANRAAAWRITALPC
jgi:hypothetical protein